MLEGLAGAGNNRLKSMYLVLLGGQGRRVVMALKLIWRLV
jgi:hypothetical protein